MMQMPVRLMRAYHNQIARLHAAEDLRALRITLAQRMKPDQIDTLVRDLREEIDPNANRIVCSDWGAFKDALRNHIGGSR